MRSSTIAPIIVMILAILLIPLDGSEASGRPDYPVEPAILCYNYEGGVNSIDVYYVRPGEAIGSSNIPELVGEVHYWIRMDTGEIVTDKSVFDSGTYMIRAYTTPPVPWGIPEESDKTSQDSNYVDWAIVGISILSSVIIIIIGGLLLMRIKK